MRRRFTMVFVLCVASLLAACATQPPAPADVNALIPVSLSQAGDAQAGALVFSQNGCAMCHATTTQKLVGPGLAGVMTAGGPTYPDGVNYGYALPNGAERSEENIAAWIVRGGRGQIGMMPGRRISEQELADLLAYLRTLSK